jgi:hypothetical protein
MGLDIFTCERRTLTLSTIGCSRLYVSANGPKPPQSYEGRSACVACPIGAFNATGKPQNPITILTNALRLLCPRCGRMAETLINGSLCRSCHARHLEALRRRNAKGSVPALSDRLHTTRIMVAMVGNIPRIVRSQGVASLSEAIIHTSKAATGPTIYGRRKVNWSGITQLEMGI